MIRRKRSRNLEADLAAFEADEPFRQQRRAMSPHADREQWDDYADAIRSDREALQLARSSGALDVEELAESLDNLLAQMHFMARACRNSLGEVPERVSALELYVRPWRRLADRWRYRSFPWQDRSASVSFDGLKVSGYNTPLSPPGT